LLDQFSQGRYATDAAFYQMMRLGVLSPKPQDDIQAAIDTVRYHNVPLLARGGGTSQCGHAINEALVLGNSKNFNEVELDLENLRGIVLPEIVPDALNRVSKPHGLWCAVDVSTASRPTIGEMAGNNS